MHDVSRSQLYQVRIPVVVRHLFGGEDRLRKRFADLGLAEVWVAKTKAAVVEAVDAARRGIEGQAAQVSVAPEITMAEAAERWIEERALAPRTRKMYREHLKPHVIRPLGSLPLHAVGRPRLAAHLAARLGAGASALNAGRDVMFVQAIVRWAAEMGWRTDASALLVRRPKHKRQVVRRFDPAALDRAIAKLEPRDRVVAEVALGTGMRAAELRAMDCSWIRWDRRIIQIPAGVTKARRERILPLPARLRSVLRAWLSGRSDGPVFPPLRSWGNGPARGREMRNVAAKLKAIAPDLVATGLHDLRHAYLSGLGAKGIPVDEVRDLAGHSSIVVTELYMHAAPGRIDRARRALDTHMDTRRRRANSKR